eukprot:jgi/Tetstr1/435881/TSEL_024769.t1
MMRRPNTKRIKAPPVPNGYEYRGFKRRELAKLKAYLDRRYEGGVEGDTVVQLVDCFFNEYPEVLEAVAHQCGLYITIEQHVVKAIRDHWSVARASFIRVTCKLTWRRYQHLIHALSKQLVEERGEHEVLVLPYGTLMCLLPSKNDVWEWEDRLAKLAGLEMSEVGKRAIIDELQALRTLLSQFPKDQLPEDKVIIQFCGTLGQDKYDYFINQMKAIKDQLMEIVYGPGMKLHGEVYTFKLTIYERKGMTKPITKSTGYAAMMAHAMGKEYGLEEPYLCPSCGLTIQRHGDFPPEDMIGDTMHACIQICPHVVWHTVHKRCKDKQTTQAAMNAMELIGLPGREVKVLSRKGKAINKADLPALSGPEVKKMLEGRQVVLDAVIPASHADRVKIQAVWERYDGMSAAWSADPGGLTAYILAAANKLWTATEMFFAAFLDIATAKDVTPYMHEVAWHFPRWMELHGNLDALSVQCMEHCNREIK